MESCFDTYFAQQDSLEEEADVVVIRVDGKVKKVTQEEAQDLFDAGVAFTVLSMDEDGNIDEYEL